MASTLVSGAIGASVRRIEGREKVTGQARYAVEYQADDVAYGWIVQADVAKGTVRGVDANAALALPGVVCVLSHENAMRLEPVDDGELAVLQSPEIAYRGQIVAAVVAESFETARQAANLLEVDAGARSHDVVLREDHPGLYAPEKVNPAYPTDTEQGDFEDGLTKAAVRHEATYETPAFHNNPMETHSTLALWEGDGLTLYDSNQGAAAHRATIAEVFGLEPDQVRVISRHVGGGFGSKGTPRPNAVLAAMLAQEAGRPVKLAVTRRQMFAFTGYRTPTLQRLTLGASEDGRLTAIAHDVVEQTSTVREFAEQTATATRMMYASPSRRTTHRVVALDVPTPSWMRTRSSIGSIPHAIELRVRNEPDVDPESGNPFSSRNLVACMREGAERFGWAGRDPSPGVRRDGRWLVGTGVAASTYPTYRRDAQATARVDTGGAYTVRIAAADIGTGSRTALTQIAADALEVAVGDVHVDLGDSALPRGPVAGGSAGTASWGTAVHEACLALRAELQRQDGVVGPGGLEASADTTALIEAEGESELARHAFGAQFAEVRVDADTGEIRVPRLLGVFAAGRIVNPVTARSQLIGGMTMGLSMALHEESVLDTELGDYLNHDLAQYHVAANADVPLVEAHWIDERDDQLNPMGSKGIGEIGIVGTAAAIANAVHHATGHRFRALPIQPDKVLTALG